MNIIVTLNATYLKPLCVMLRSLLDVHPGRYIEVYVIHTDLREGDFNLIGTVLNDSHLHLNNVRVPTDFLADLPITFHYCKEMYYRIFAATLLPFGITRALYLDPDMVILSPLDNLYSIDMDDAYFAAARSINRISGALFKWRLHMPKDTQYFNSGVLLMNLELLRRHQRKQDIFDFIFLNRDKLLLPDQDILNALYASKTILLDPVQYNFDVRYYHALHLLTFGRISLKSLPRKTHIIHYCGKHKPWHDNYRGACGKYYQMIHLRLFSDDVPLFSHT